MVLKYEPGNPFFDLKVKTVEQFMAADVARNSLELQQMVNRELYEGYMCRVILWTEFGKEHADHFELLRSMGKSNYEAWSAVIEEIKKDKRVRPEWVPEYPEHPEAIYGDTRLVLQPPPLSDHISNYL